MMLLDQMHECPHRSFNQSISGGILNCMLYIGVSVTMDTEDRKIQAAYKLICLSWAEGMKCMHNSIVR